MSKIVTFIGAGNMARSLIAGLISDHSDFTIRVSDPSEQVLDSIKRYWPSVITFRDNNEAAIDSDLVVLAVKPNYIQHVCHEIKTQIKEDQPLVISIAAGIRLQNINTWLGNELPVVRCMPNTPALVQAGASGMAANMHVTTEQKSMAEQILRAVGLVLWFDDETSLDAVTATSGSGPAYYFLVMEAMQKAAIKLGLNEKEARLLVLQTAMGAAKLALESNDSPATLRKNVTSKGGTTEAALNVLNEGHLVNLFEQAMTAANDRSIELANATLNTTAITKEPH